MDGVAIGWQGGIGDEPRGEGGGAGAVQVLAEFQVEGLGPFDRAVLQRGDGDRLHRLIGGELQGEFVQPRDVSVIRRHPHGAEVDCRGAAGAAAGDGVCDARAFDRGMRGIRRAGGDGIAEYRRDLVLDMRHDTGGTRRAGRGGEDIGAEAFGSLGQRVRIGLDRKAGGGFLCGEIDRDAVHAPEIPRPRRNPGRRDIDGRRSAGAAARDGQRDGVAFGRRCGLAGAAGERIAEHRRRRAGFGQRHDALDRRIPEIADRCGELHIVFAAGAAPWVAHGEPVRAGVVAQQHERMAGHQVLFAVAGIVGIAERRQPADRPAR